MQIDINVSGCAEPGGCSMFEKGNGKTFFVNAGSESVVLFHSQNHDRCLGPGDKNLCQSTRYS